MNACSRESVSLQSLGDRLSATLFPAESERPTPALIVAHGAGDFKEHYFELCEYIAQRGIACLAVDMHGHGQSEGERYHVNIEKWVADIGAAADFLSKHPKVDAERIAAFGISSGGTAILEAAIIDPRIKALIALDATVRDSLPFFQSAFFHLLIAIARLKKSITGTDWKIPLLKLSGELHVASDPEVNARLTKPELLEAFRAFPLPGGAPAFFVDTIRRVGSIRVPTLVIWGEDDKLDPPETARLLAEALTCQKQLHIIPGNGHAGHADRNRQKVFELTAEWILQNLGSAHQTVVGAADVFSHC
jgi:uncharacterized protein